MINYPVVRIDILQKVLKDLFEDELGIPIIWGSSNLPRPPRPYGRLALITGPVRPRIMHENILRVTQSEFLIEVPVPAIGDTFLVRVNGVPHRYTAVDILAETLKQALIALINADREPALATDTGPTELTVTETNPGSIISLVADAPLVVTVGPGTVPQDIKSWVSRSPMTMSFQIYGADNKVGTSGSAGDIMGRVPLILDLDRTLATLEDFRITLNDIAGPTDISDLEGGGALQESRHVMDLRAVITSMYSEVISIIESTEGEIIIGSETIPIVVP